MTIQPNRPGQGLSLTTQMTLAIIAVIVIVAIAAWYYAS